MNFYKVKKLGYNIIEIVGIILLLWIIRPGMSYARVKSLGSSSVEVYKGQYIPVSVFSGHKWSIESYDSDIVSVWKTTVGSVVPAIYCKGVNAGTTTIKMSDNTTGIDYTMYFKVKKRDISSGKVVLFQDIVEYSERKITMPVTSVTLNNGNTPVYNYYVTYENNKERGTATVIVHGKGNNYGEIRKKFYIKERDISNGYVTLDQDTFEYNAYEKRPNARLWLSRAGLPPLEVKDVDVRYENNVNAGTARVIVSGKNGNIGRIVKKFTITKRNISSGKIEFKREYIETGHQIKPIRTDIKVCTKTGGEIFDYKIKRYGINKSGYGTITVEGKNNNTGEITGRFRIYKNIMNGEISTFLDCSTYTGKEIKPNATVSYSGIKLTKDIDYTLKYINNVNVGTATIMATGKGFYRGVRMKTFTIKPRNINKTNNIVKALYANVKNESGNGYTKTITVGNRKYNVYNQGAFYSNYGSIGSGGCSITSMAIVLSGYGQNKTPTDIASKLHAVTITITDIANGMKGYGVNATATTNNNAENNTNIKNKAKNDIDNNLKIGKPVIILVRQNRNKAAVRFSEGGEQYTLEAHYIVLVGYGQNGKPVVADPNSGQVHNLHSLDTIINDYIYAKSDGGYEQGYVLIN